MKEIFFLLFKKTHFVSYLTTYTDTSHMYSGTESQTLQTSRLRSLDHLWVEGFSYTFLNLWSHIETGAHTTKPLLTEPPTHMCRRSPTHQLGNGKYVVSMSFVFFFADWLLVRNKAFSLTCGLRSSVRWWWLDNICRLSCSGKSPVFIVAG